MMQTLNAAQKTKKTAAGRIPVDWEVVRLSEIVSIIKGKMPDSFVDTVAEGVLPYVSSEYLRTNQIARYGEVTRNLVLLNAGDLILLWDGSNAGDFFRAKRGILSSTMVRIDLNSDKIDRDFLYYLLKTKEKYFKATIKGAGIPHVDGGIFHDLDVPMPPLQEQKKVSGILFSVDQVIDKTQTVIDQTQQLKKALMQELFTRGIPGKHKKFKKTKIGEIPEEWSLLRMENIATRIGDGIHTTPKYVAQSDFYFINGNNLEDGNIVIGDNAKYVSEEEYNKHCKDLSNRSILISINGTIGNMAFYRGERVVLGKSAAYITCDENINIEYIYYFLQTDMAKEYFYAELTGSTIQNLSLGSIRNMSIPIPDSREQEDIAQLLTLINRKIDRERLLLARQNYIKHALVQVLLTGEVRVKG